MFNFSSCTQVPKDIMKKRAAALKLMGDMYKAAGAKGKKQEKGGRVIDIDELEKKATGGDSSSDKDDSKGGKDKGKGKGKDNGNDDDGNDDDNNAKGKGKEKNKEKVEDEDDNKAKENGIEKEKENEHADGSPQASNLEGLD